MLDSPIIMMLHRTRKPKNSGGWIRTIDLRVMSPSGSPGYPTPLRGCVYSIGVRFLITILLLIKVAYEEQFTERQDSHMGSENI